ncbi:MAG TPA: phosphodiester glycosidase family protein [Armatimonadota bacterium]|jgi:hypothetical protein
MRKAIVLLLLAPFCLPARAEKVRTTVIRPGVTLVQTIIGADEPGGPEMIHCLLVNPRQRGVRLEAGLGGDTVEEAGGGMEAVTKLVARTGALAGVNADFFPFTGDPLGLEIHQGVIVSEPAGGPAALGILKGGRLVMGRPGWRATVSSADGAAFALAGVNREFGRGELGLFAPVYGEKTPAAPATIVALDAPKAALRSGKPITGKVTKISDETGAVANATDGFLLSGTDAAAEFLKAHAQPGQTVTIRADVVEDGVPWSEVREAVGGRPILLRDGREDMRLAEEHVAQDFSTTRHPRTAVGVQKDGTVMLVAVDGRQILSRGMSLPELTAWLKSHGAVDAINLDGGGSTCLSVAGLAVNCPSDGIVRRVADSLLVFGDAKALRPAKRVIQHDAQRVTAGAAGVTAAATSTTPAIWGTDNAGAFADQGGDIYGYKGGTAEVVRRALNGSAEDRWPVEVLPGPAGKMLLAWKDGALRVTIRDVNNNPVAGQEIEIETPDGRRGEVATGKDGSAIVPASLVPDEKAGATLVSGPLTKKWPEAK